MLKKLLVITAIASIALTGCAQAPTEKPKEQEVESEVYFVNGRYYIDDSNNGTIITEDGNIWGYTQEVISEEPSYNNEPVIVGFDDKGTTQLEDDEVLGVILDRNTQIYDALEASLSEEFDIEREGNNIKIHNLK